MTRSATNWDALQGAIAGEVVLPGSPGYETARRPAIARFAGARPQAVVRCASPADVAEAIALARRAGLPAVARSGGHCFAGRSSTEGVVIDVAPLRSVSLSGTVATVGAGARLGELYDALLAHGRTIPGGCGPDVGIAGLTLGGGLGILGRKHGLTSDSLVGAQVALADGRLVDCDERRDADLFWALRGAGGGNFGVVTSLRFDTLPPPAATSFHLVWPHAQAAALIGAWQAWAPDAPDELAASLLMQASGDVESPPLAHVFGALLGPEREAAELLDRLIARAGAEPASASYRHGTFRETKRYLAEHGPGDEQAEQGHLFSRSEFFRGPLPADAAAALVEHFAAGRAPGEARELDFTPWGGAYNRVPAAATAFAHRGERFLLKHSVVVAPDAPGDARDAATRAAPSSAARDAARRWLTRSWALARPWGSGGVYPNFPDPELADPGHAYHGANLDRLLRVSATYDPDDFFGFAARS